MKIHTGMIRGVLLSVTLAVTALGAFPAGADSILWQQTPLDGGGSFITNYSNLDYAASFDAGPGWRMDELTWWGADALEGTVEESVFEISFFADDGTGAPGAEVASIMGEASTVNAGFQSDLTHGTLGDDIELMRDAHEFSLELDAPVTLGPGIHYFSVDLADSEDWRHSWMVSDAGAASSAWVLSQAEPTNGIQAAGTENGFDAQEQPEYDLAFQVNGAVVPEPATVTLLGMGLAGLSLRRLKRRA